MAGLQELKGYLQSERKRIERGTIRYKNLTKTASASVKTILDAVSQLHPALKRFRGHGGHRSSARLGAVNTTGARTGWRTSVMATKSCFSRPERV